MLRTLDKSHTQMREKCEEGEQDKTNNRENEKENKRRSKKKCDRNENNIDIYIYMLPPRGLPFHLYSLEKLTISKVGGEHAKLRETPCVCPKSTKMTLTRLFWELTPPFPSTLPIKS